MTNVATSALRLPPEPAPFEQAVEAFGRRLAAEGCSPSTISAYLRDLRRLSAVLSEHHPGLAPGHVTSALLDEALTSPAVVISATGTARAPASLHRFKAAVRSFFAWAEETGQVTENPARLVTLRRLPPTTPSFLTEAEKRRLLKELRGRSSKLARRDRLIIELFLGTGIRLRELVNLDVDDVDLDAKHLRVRAKGGVPAGEVSQVHAALPSARLPEGAPPPRRRRMPGRCFYRTATRGCRSARCPGGSIIGSRRRGSTKSSAHTPCGTPSPPTYTATPATSWWSSGRWGTVIYRPPRSTPTWSTTPSRMPSNSSESERAVGMVGSTAPFPPLGGVLERPRTRLMRHSSGAGRRKFPCFRDRTDPPLGVIRHHFRVLRPLPPRLPCRPPIG